MNREPVATVEVSAKDLEGPGVVFCPNPKMALWSAHPRVFIDVVTAGEGKCPYRAHGLPPEGGREGPRALSRAGR